MNYFYHPHYPTLHYDLRLRLRQPSSSSQSQALIFFPGLLESHLSYAKILGQLSDRTKIPIVLINAESWGRVVVGGVTPEYTNQIITDVEQQLFVPSTSSKDKNHRTHKNPNNVIQEWIIGGHSMGAMICTDLIRSSILDRRIQRMILWATTLGFDITTTTSITTTRQQTTPDDSRDCRVLLINAEHDGVMNTMNPNKEHFIKTKLGGPTNNNVQHLVIKGGNHDGFGNYGPQYFPHPDGIRTISREQQQKEILQSTIEFLHS